MQGNKLWTSFAGLKKRRKTGAVLSAPPRGRDSSRCPAARIRVLCAIVLALAPGLTAGPKKLKPVKAGPNPAEYVAFSKKLLPDDQLKHALDRLTFGARPGDLQQLRQIGLSAWLDLELHPERVPENPLLLDRLQPYESLRMDARQAYLHYPPPQMIAAVARGNAPLPEDPELRAVVVHLADKYLAKKSAAADNASAVATTVKPDASGVFFLNQPANKPVTVAAKDPNDDADLDLRVRLADILTRDQIQTLRLGSPDQKREVLASIPAGKRADFVYALHKDQRQKLFMLAPVDLRRQMMLAVNPQNVVADDLTEGKLLRAAYSSHQLDELLVDFWFNHFNVFLNKGADKYLTPTYERDAIRPYVLGKFHDMLLATAKSPAMLFYLDNWESVGTDTPVRPNQKNKRGLNENYGRELLELHTLGVDGGYTQKDVIEVARCFTGWTIANPRKGGGFEFNEKVHDKGQKVVLGHVIPSGGGMGDGLKVLEIVSHHPATAHYISLKLAQRFVADNPPPSLVNRMADTFTKTDGDLREVMRTMLTSGEFWSEGAYKAKMKSPFEMIVSSVRATDADVSSAYVLAAEIQKLGEPLYRKIEPTGYSNLNAEWISSAALLDRMNFALTLSHNRLPGVKVNIVEWQNEFQADPLGLAKLILEKEPSAQTRTAIEKALSDETLQKQLTQNANAGPPKLPSVVAGLTLGSPDFQRH